MKRAGGHLTRALLERSLATKVRDYRFGTDIGPLLAHGYRFDMDQAPDCRRCGVH